jgi:ATP-dependent helicase HrpB
LTSTPRSDPSDASGASGQPAELSVRTVLPRLVEALAGGGRAAVLVAPPGSGKTTLVPPALRAAGIGGGGRRIVMLEPRRIAARAAARRIAEQGGWRLGAEAGYQIRFERRASAATEILVVTEGILVQMLQADPFLEGIGVLIFDEFHERSLATDLSLAMARKAQREVRPDLVLLAMSATLDPGPLAAFLGGCPVLAAEGRSHPVEVIYQDERQAPPPPGVLSPSGMPSPAQVAAGVRRALEVTAGDVLAFLPGVGEILRTADALGDLAARRDLAVTPLYGDLPAERQDRALRPDPGGRRKVVLATNVAETSITVEGVTAVVDTGLARRLRYDPACGLDRLELARISRAAADQRAGRAGRQGPGLCLRLWPAREHAARPPYEVPEIARVDLAGPALQLLAWGETDLPSFGWFEPPAPASLRAARQLLASLGAITEGGRGRLGGLTEVGRRMARLPVHPRLARLLLAGHQPAAARDAALLAALLAERDPFVRPPRGGSGRGPGGGARRAGRDERQAAAVQASRSDLLDRVDALLRWEAAGARGEAAGARTASRGGGEAPAATGAPEPALEPAAARFVLRARDQLAELAERELGRATNHGGATPPPDRDEVLLRALLAAYPDRLARRRAPHDPRAVMVGGRGVRLAEQSAVTAAELLLCVEIVPVAAARQSEDLVRLASEVAPEWLPGERLRTRVEVAFDGERERVTAWERTRYQVPGEPADELVLADREVPPPDADEAAALLAEAAAARLHAALPLDDPEIASLLVRLRCLAGWMPELGLPRLDDAALAGLLPELARGRRSFAELRRAPWLARLRGALSAGQLAALEREAPERLAVPSGSRIRLTYAEDEPPVLAVRIQELFGLGETPRVAGGRVPVLLHLLAPNLRPQQVTGDLRSFWRNTYPQVRKELQGRYPRHAWPEDPWQAPPQRRPAPRGKPSGRGGRGPA